MSYDVETLARRVESLERRNRALSAGLFLFPLLALVGWQAATPDVIRARRFEVVDERGVPLVVLAPDRGNTGGSVVLRDAQGEKRGWWQVGPSVTQLGMSLEGPKDTVRSIGFGIAPDGTRLSLISPKGAVFSAAIEGEQPKLELTAPNGASLFTAPWKRP